MAPAASAAATSPMLWPSTMSGLSPSATRAAESAACTANMSGWITDARPNARVEIGGEHVLLHAAGADGLEGGVDLVEALAEGGVAQISGAAHAHRLRAIAGIDEAHLGAPAGAAPVATAFEVPVSASSFKPAATTSAASNTATAR